MIEKQSIQDPEVVSTDSEPDYSSLDSVNIHLVSVRQIPGWAVCFGLLISSPVLFI